MEAGNTVSVSVELEKAGCCRGEKMFLGATYSYAHTLVMMKSWKPKCTAYTPIYRIHTTFVRKFDLNLMSYSSFTHNQTKLTALVTLTHQRH